MDRFFLSPDEALKVLAQVSHAVIDWRAMALSDEVGLNEKELEDFAPAFEHAGIEEARGFLCKS